MKKIILILIIFYMIQPLNAQNSRAFTLEEAIAYGLNNSVDIRDAQINVTDADQRVVEAKSIGIPHLNFKSSYNYYFKLPVTILPDEFGINPITGEMNPNFDNEVAFGTRNTFDMGLEFSTLLFDGSYFTGLEAAKYYTNQARLSLDSERDKVRNNVRDAYLPALIIEENRKILQKNIDNLKKLFFETKELYKAGFVEQLDVDRLELSLANLDAEMQNLEDQKDLVLNYLKFLMGYPLGQKLEVSDNLEELLIVPANDDLAGAIDYTERSEYRVVQSAIKLNELNVKRFKDGYLPQLLAFGGYSWNWQGNKFKNGSWYDTGLVGIQLNVPIFDGFDKKAKVQRASLQLEMVKNRRKKLENAIELEIHNARTSYSNAKQRVEDRKKNVELAEKIYKTSQVKYKEGVGSSLEITTAEQGLFQAQANYINARYDLLVAKVNLDKALGR